MTSTRIIRILDSLQIGLNNTNGRRTPPDIQYLTTGCDDESF